jgi:Ca-activated chloride channel family protein
MDQPYVRNLWRRRTWKAILLTTAIGCLVIALMQPQCDPEEMSRKVISRNIVVCLDVSKSMLAEDIKPNRLQRAKLALKEMVKALKGDRIGLVLFAGDTVVKCPLTMNYSYFLSALDDASISSVSKPGTKIGDAIRRALRDVLGLERKREGRGAEANGAEKSQSSNDILIITDGEDHRSYPEEAAKTAAELGVGIYCVGIGDPAGSLIPVKNEEGQVDYLKYRFGERKGQRVLSALDSTLLLNLVKLAPRGVYLPVETANPDLVSFYREQIAAHGGKEVQMRIVSWGQVYQFFVLLALVLLLAVWLTRERPAGAGALVVKEWA